MCVCVCVCIVCVSVCVCVCVWLSVVSLFRGFQLEWPSALKNLFVVFSAFNLNPDLAHLGENFFCFSCFSCFSCLGGVRFFFVGHMFY